MTSKTFTINLPENALDMLFLTLSRITWERKAKSGNKYALIYSYGFVQFLWVRTTFKPLPTNTHSYNTLDKPRWTLRYSYSILTSENFRWHHVLPVIRISQRNTESFCFTYQVSLVLVHAKYHKFGAYSTPGHTRPIIDTFFNTLFSGQLMTLNTKICACSHQTLWD